MSAATIMDVCARPERVVSSDLDRPRGLLAEAQCTRPRWAALVERIDRKGRPHRDTGAAHPARRHHPRPAASCRGGSTDRRRFAPPIFFAKRNRNFGTAQ